MIYAKTQPSEKRKNLRQMLDDISSASKSKKIIQFVGAFNPICAKLIETKEFDGVYISGAVLSADLCLPDIGLTTLTEVMQRGHQISRVTSLPTMIDVDTGFGEPMSAARTLLEAENAGISACHFEDQINPKRCGHLDGKELISIEDMQKKINAAANIRRDKNFVIIARTDARGVEGLDNAIARANAYIDAGADMIFPEALKDLSEFEEFAKGVNVPILANMTEFGKSALYNIDELSSAGVSMVIYPVTSLRLAMGACDKAFTMLKKDGHQNNSLSMMQHRKDLYELLEYEKYNSFDERIFNFKVGDTPSNKE